MPKAQITLLFGLLAGAPAYADHVVSKQTKDVTVEIPVDTHTFECFENQDDYGNDQTHVRIHWDYRPYAFLPNANPLHFYWYSRRLKCPPANAFLEEAQKNGGKISRRLSIILEEKIGTTLGGCTRYQEENAYLSFREASHEASGSQNRILEELPIAACGF